MLRPLLLCGVLLAACAADDEPRPDDLVRAAGAGRLEAVRALLRDGADVDGRDARGRTAVTERGH